MLTTTAAGKPIGILGGTFDPIHHGHLRLAIELYERLELAEVRLIPAAHPPHRDDPAAAAQLRLQMLQLAITGVPGLIADERELKRSGPSYMVNTLESLRTDYPQTPLCLILGMDAFMSLFHWHQWQRLIQFAHLILVRRLGVLLTEHQLMTEFLRIHQIHDPQMLTKQLAGSIWLEEIPALTISATQIRSLIMAGKNPSYLLPVAVLELIHHYQLYQ
ncbi:MAG: nicotinate-nucleotide adenylyltransferase [Pseudomonadota bacterium]|nr:nicotinate-nucleotide adenylyltransferase [Pseudomonadota bacterium]